MDANRGGARARRGAIAWTLGAAAALLVPLPALLADLAGEGPALLPLDKLAHAVLFALLGRAWLAAAAQARGAATLAVAGGAVAYGGLLELLQPLAAGRTAELLDLAADAAGVALAALTRFAALRYRRAA